MLLYLSRRLQEKNVSSMSPRVESQPLGQLPSFLPESDGSSQGRGMDAKAPGSSPDAGTDPPLGRQLAGMSRRRPGRRQAGPTEI